MKKALGGKRKRKKEKGFFSPGLALKILGNFRSF